MECNTNFTVLYIIVNTFMITSLKFHNVGNSKSVHSKVDLTYTFPYLIVTSSQSHDLQPEKVKTKCHKCKGSVNNI